MSFISYLVNGLSLGSVYALIALGYTMVYGIAKMLNFAHGDVIMIGAYVALVSMNQAGMPIPAAVLISIVACTVLGVVMERIAYKPLRNASSNCRRRKASLPNSSPTAPHLEASAHSAKTTCSTCWHNNQRTCRLLERTRYESNRQSAHCGNTP